MLSVRQIALAALVAVLGMFSYGCAPSIGGAGSAAEPATPISDHDSPPPGSRPPTGLLQLIVTKVDGSPATGCWIDRQGPGLPTEQAIVTDTDGRAELRLEPGHWTIKASCDGGLSGTAQVVIDGSVTTEATVTVKP